MPLCGELTWYRPYCLYDVLFCCHCMICRPKWNQQLHNLNDNISVPSTLELYIPVCCIMSHFTLYYVIARHFLEWISLSGFQLPSIVMSSKIKWLREQVTGRQCGYDSCTVFIIVIMVLLSTSWTWTLLSVLFHLLCTVAELTLIYGYVILYQIIIIYRKHKKQLYYLSCKCCGMLSVIYVSCVLYTVANRQCSTCTMEHRKVSWFKNIEVFAEKRLEH